MTGDTTPISDEADDAAEFMAARVERWGADVVRLADIAGGAADLYFSEHRADEDWLDADYIYAGMAAVLAAAPLLVSAEAERRDEFPEHLIAQRDEAQAHLAEAEREVEGLRGEMDSERTARARDLVRYSQDAMFLRLNAAETQRDVALDLVEGLRAELALREVARDEAICQRDDFRAELAALRAVGGQEKPTDLAALLHRAFEYQWDQCDHGTYTGGPSNGEPYAMCERIAAHVLRAAPVGGQAEPSDAIGRALRASLDANKTLGGMAQEEEQLGRVYLNMIARLRALIPHMEEPGTSGGVCMKCTMPWPCEGDPTAAAVSGEQR